MQTTPHTVYLALGSNLGDRRSNLTAALQCLHEVIELHSISSVYETEPVGYRDQADFLNMVCCGKTSLPVEELLQHVKSIEVALGRKPSFRNAPRPIDIDILLYDDLRLQQEHLTIPHPRMAERAFVLIPLVEISPHVVDPVSGYTAEELLRNVSQEGVKKIA